MPFEFWWKFGTLFSATSNSFSFLPLVSPLSFLSPTLFLFFGSFLYPIFLFFPFSTLPPSLTSKIVRNRNGKLHSMLSNARDRQYRWPDNLEMSGVSSPFLSSSFFYLQNAFVHNREFVQRIAPQWHRCQWSERNKNRQSQKGKTVLLFAT